MSGDPTRPSGYFAAITPSDTTLLSKVDGDLPRAIYVGGAGNIVAVRMDGATVTFTAATAGSVIPIRYSRINSTNTTATALVALY